MGVLASLVLISYSISLKPLTVMLAILESGQNIV